MPYIVLRTLLTELQEELCALLEQGLAHGGRGDALPALAAQLQRSGLTEGARLTGLLCEELDRARLDPDWAPQRAAQLLARLWRYQALCRRRLEYLQARDRLGGAQQPE